jgi:hypothetical protein
MLCTQEEKERKGKLFTLPLRTFHDIPTSIPPTHDTAL